MKKILILLVLSFGFSSTEIINNSINIQESRDAYCRYEKVRVGAICNDGWRSSSTGSGTCSWHQGVREWLYQYKYVCN